LTLFVYSAHVQAHRAETIPM